MENKGNIYNINLEGNGLSVKKEIDEETARRILNIILGGSAAVGIRIAPDNPKFISGSFPFPTEHAKKNKIEQNIENGQPHISLREHLDEVQANRNPDKILAIASYIIDTLGEDEFGAEDIKSYFRKASEKMPANYARDFKLVEAQGWISEHHKNPGRYYITKTGREALKSKFAKDLVKPQNGLRLRKKKRKNNNIANGAQE